MDFVGRKELESERTPEEIERRMRLINLSIY
jgi:hypothetical protein